MNFAVANIFTDDISDNSFIVANNHEKNLFKKYFFDKSISDGSLFLAMNFAVANTFIDGISDGKVAIANTPYMQPRVGGKICAFVFTL